MAEPEENASANTSTDATLSTEEASQESDDNAPTESDDAEKDTTIGSTESSEDTDELSSESSGSTTEDSTDELSNDASSTETKTDMATGETTSEETTTTETDSDTTVSSETPPPATSEDGLLMLTSAQLATYNGKDGQPAYIAYKGIIYDVSNIGAWGGGNHYGGNTAGFDMTDELQYASHGEEKLEKATIVGQLIK